MKRHDALMSRHLRWGLTLLLLVLSATLAFAEAPPADEALARYARYGADAWARNPTARISGDGTACVSCHTSLPYALVEPLIPGDYPAYSDMIAMIDRRVLTWSENAAWYADEKLVQMAALSGMPAQILIDLLDAEDSRGTEVVLSALIRATHDAYSGMEPQRETQRAFENLWAMQIEDGPAFGRWPWIQLNLVPWEVDDSDVWGAALACAAAGIYPGPAPAEKLDRLRASLAESSADPEVSLHTKAAILWCNTELEGRVLEKNVADDLIQELVSKQRPNGGWALREIGPWPAWEGSESDCCPNRELRSDAYATGVVAFALALHPDKVPGEVLDRARVWIELELANPYPDGPRFNRHSTGDVDVPEFRNNLYTNAGHMWAYLARATMEKGHAPWAAGEEAEEPR